MFLFIMFLVCFCSMFDIVMIDNEFMYKFVKRLSQYSSDLSGRHYVSMVLIWCLRMDVLYIPGHVVDCGCKTPVESFIVHSPSVGQVGHGCEGSLALFLIFLIMFLMLR
jgi:hypothetical protein